MVYATEAGVAARTRFSRHTAEGALIWRSEYFGPPPSPPGTTSVDPGAPRGPAYADPAPGEVRPPQAFLVEQEPGAIVHPHFHFVDQFQVVVDGGGTIGKHAVRAVSAHFAAAHTGYGPIRAGTSGLKYFSLRASADSTGAQYLPGARDRMRAGPRRNVFADPVVPSSEDALRRLAGPAVATALEAEDGLAIHVLRIPPGGTLAAPEPAAGGGQSFLVIAGTVLRDGAALGLWSALFAAADEPACLFRAGPGGAEVLALRYPRPAPMCDSPGMANGTADS
ncbi:MAG: hypothetical protein IT561_22840 [Alphaproteobacteria bacterium]|nr:hypothetical protein [Alphaproteobacteria bacterium]